MKRLHPDEHKQIARTVSMLMGVLRDEASCGHQAMVTLWTTLVYLTQSIHTMGLKVGINRGPEDILEACALHPEDLAAITELIIVPSRRKPDHAPN